MEGSAESDQQSSQQQGSQPKTAKRREAKDPVYTVVAVDGKNLTVLEPQQSAKRQQDACAIVRDRLIEEKEEVPRLAAFLTNSFKEMEYEEQVVRSWKAREHAPSFID